MSQSRRRISLLFGLATLLWLAGCGGTLQPTRISDSVGTVVATLILSPELPVPMQDTTLAIELQDNGRPVVGATVALTLTMPGCPMAPSYPTLQDEGAGLYRAQTVLTMSGIWQTDARVTFPDGQDPSSRLSLQPNEVKRKESLATKAIAHSPTTAIAICARGAV